MDAEQRLADALRAQAAGGAWSAPNPARPAAPVQTGPGRRRRRQVLVALMVALLVGVLLGAGLAALSVLVPGLLPPLG